jgi:hypothetical protein
VDSVPFVAFPIRVHGTAIHRCLSVASISGGAKRKKDDFWRTKGDFLGAESGVKRCFRGVPKAPDSGASFFLELHYM